LILLDSLKDTVQSLDIHLDPKTTSIIKKIVPKRVKLPGISDLQPRRVSWSDNITSKFKENMWCDKELVDNRKLRYYKDVVNPNLEDQNYLSVLKRAKKKIIIAKIRTNSHELHSETRCWTTPKTPWDERIHHLCDTK
jgi:hypothetical protein